MPLQLMCDGGAVLATLLAWNLSVESAVMKRSDVAFMYQADQKTYQEYGATILAWGGKPTAKSLEQSRGVTFFGSVGMVTEFSRYYERFPQSYQEGLCRDVHGHPVKVPWLTDHQHKGVPFWWCCTQQPQFRQYLRERVLETVQAGAHGVHIDDHMGSSGGLWLGLCFCDRCVDGFAKHLRAVPAAELERLGIRDIQDFNYREVVKAWLAEDASQQRKPPQHPLWSQWTIYQCRAAAAFMEELRGLATETAGRPIPMGANAGLLWPRHLADYKSLDLFSAETDHHAQARRFSDLPILAYRMADAVGRPYAATASGGDWAYIKEHNLPGLVRGWIALSYAAGHCLMAPHRQWCHTPEKGTHWYQGPAEKFAPLYQFIRQNAALFDEYESYADVAVLMPHAAFVKDTRRWFDLAKQLAGKNVSYRLLLAGDEIVDHPLKAEELASATVLLMPATGDLLPADRRLLDQHTPGKMIHRTVPEALSAIQPAVQAENTAEVRLLPRVKPGSAVIHLLNYQYEAVRDDVQTVRQVKIKFDRSKLGVPGATTCAFIAPGKEPQVLPVRDGAVTVPDLELWGILALGKL